MSNSINVNVFISSLRSKDMEQGTLKQERTEEQSGNRTGKLPGKAGCELTASSLGDRLAPQSRRRLCRNGINLSQVSSIINSINASSSLFRQFILFLLQTMINLRFQSDCFHFPVAQNIFQQHIARDFKY